MVVEMDLKMDSSTGTMLVDLTAQTSDMKLMGVKMAEKMDKELAAVKVDEKDKLKVGLMGLQKVVLLESQKADVMVVVKAG